MTSGRSEGLPFFGRSVSYAIAMASVTDAGRTKAEKSFLFHYTGEYKNIMAIKTTKIGIEKTSWTATELLCTEMPEVQWAIEELMPCGFFFLGGPPKIGKSYLTLQWLIATASKNGTFLGRKVKHGKVLYISFEDNARRLKKRLRELGSPDVLDNLEIEIGWKPINKGGLEDLSKRLKSKKYNLVVLDPYNRAFRLKNNNDTDEVTKYLSPLHEWTQSGEITIGFIDHHHKHSQFSGDVIEDISGSISKGGVADTVWALNRQRGKKEARLMIASRDTDIDLVEIVSTGKVWSVKSEVAEGTIQASLIEYMEQYSEQDAYITEIADKLKKDKSIISKEMKELVSKGIIKEGIRDGRRVPFTLVSKNGKK